MSDYRDYLIERAQYMDTLARTSIPEKFPEYRQRAFQLRKKARQDPDMDEFEKIPDERIDGAISLMRSLEHSDRLTSEQQSLLGRAMNIVDQKTDRGN